MTRFGILVDGQAEFRALPALLERIETEHVLLSPLYADIQPFAPIGQIVGTIRSKLPVLATRKVDCAIVLIDRETRDECPGELAAMIARDLLPACGRWGITSTAIVIKDRTFENWLISDPDALRAMPQRFQVGVGHARSISNGVDRLDAQSIIKRIVQDDSYDKVADAVRILRKASPEKMGQSSRSFRRFLRIVGHPEYLDQSARPYRAA